MGRNVSDYCYIIIWYYCYWPFLQTVCNILQWEPVRTFYIWYECVCCVCCVCVCGFVCQGAKGDKLKTYDQLYLLPSGQLFQFDQKWKVSILVIFLFSSFWFECSNGAVIIHLSPLCEFLPCKCGFSANQPTNQSISL